MKLSIVAGIFDARVGLYIDFRLIHRILACFMQFLSFGYDKICRFAEYNKTPVNAL